MFVLPILFNALFFIEMAFFGIVLVYVGLQNKGKHPYGYYSSLLAAIQVFAIAIAMIAINSFPPTHQGMLPYPYTGFMQWWAWAWAAITTAFFVKVKREGKRPCIQAEPSPVEKQPGSPDPSCPPDDGLKYHHEKARKAFHLAGFLALASYLFVAPLLSILINQAIVKAGSGYEILWGPLSEAYLFSDTSLEEAAITLTLFALCATVILVMFVDTPRLLAGDEYSIIVLVEKRVGKILRDKEKGGPGAQDYIAISSTCGWLVGILFRPALPGTEAIQVALGAIMISTLADGAAAIVGKAYGRHKVKRPHNQVKSVEGFIAGLVVAFICAMFFMNWIVALVVAGVFLLIDYWSPPVADNAINAVTLTMVGCLVSMLV